MPDEKPRYLWTASWDSKITVAWEKKSFTCYFVTVSLNWTNWDVKKEDCDATCNNVGGTVEASRQCHSHTETLEPSVCAQHNSITRNVKCKDYCSTSGKSIKNYATYSILLQKLFYIALCRRASHCLRSHNDISRTTGPRTQAPWLRGTRGSGDEKLVTHKTIVLHFHVTE